IDLDEDDECVFTQKTKKREVSDNKYQRALASLRFRITTTFNNSQCKAKHTTSGRPIKGIKERLTGKDGQIRDNMMGKRCNQTGRTVIGPEPTLRIGQLEFPEEMANNLTVPVNVSDFNIDQLQEMVDNGSIDTLKKPDGK